MFYFLSNTFHIWHKKSTSFFQVNRFFIGMIVVLSHILRLLNLLSLLLTLLKSKRTYLTAGQFYCRKTLFVPYEKSHLNMFWTKFPSKFRCPLCSSCDLSVTIDYFPGKKDSWLLIRNYWWKKCPYMGYLLFD